MLKARKPALTDDLLAAGEGAVVEPPYAVGAYHTLQRKMLPCGAEGGEATNNEAELSPIQLQQLWLAKLLHDDALSVSSYGEAKEARERAEAEAAGDGKKGAASTLLLRVMSLHGRSAKQTLRTLRRQPSFSRVRGRHAQEVEALEAACARTRCSSDTEEEAEESASVRSSTASFSAASHAASSASRAESAVSRAAT